MCSWQCSRCVASEIVRHENVLDPSIEMFCEVARTTWEELFSRVNRATMRRCHMRPSVHPRRVADGRALCCTSDKRGPRQGGLQSSRGSAPWLKPESEPVTLGVKLGNTKGRRKETLLKTGALQKAIFNSANFSSIATDAKGVIQISI